MGLAGQGMVDRTLRPGVSLLRCRNCRLPGLVETFCACLYCESIYTVMVAAGIVAVSAGPGLTGYSSQPWVGVVAVPTYHLAQWRCSRTPDSRREIFFSAEIKQGIILLTNSMYVEWRFEVY